MTRPETVVFRPAGFAPPGITAHTFDRLEFNFAPAVFREGFLWFEKELLEILRFGDAVVTGQRPAGR
jgi:hypothetical protein